MVIKYSPMYLAFFQVSDLVFDDQHRLLHQIVVGRHVSAVELYNAWFGPLAEGRSRHKAAQ